MSDFCGTRRILWFYLTFTLIVLAVCIGIAVYMEYPLYHDEYWESAPDGIYKVNCYGEAEDGKVWFPICPMSHGTATQLHGFWKVNEHAAQQMDWQQRYIVTLENNVIVEAVKIPIDTSTVYGQFDQWNYDHRNTITIFLANDRRENNVTHEWQSWYQVKEKPEKPSIYRFEGHLLFESLNATEAIKWAMNYLPNGSVVEP